MALVDNIREMKQKGISNEEITKSLTDQGIPPNEIQNAIEESEVQAASPPQTQEINETYTQSAEPIPEAQYQPQEQYPPGPSTGYETDTMYEIAEQTAAEKLASIKHIISEMQDFKAISQAKIEDIEARLKKLEDSFTLLQANILGKISEYGKTMRGLTKEMQAVEKSFSKIVPKSKKRK